MEREGDAGPAPQREPVGSGAPGDADAADRDEPQPVRPEVRALAGSPSRAVGDTVELSVAIAFATDVAHVPFHLRFDPRVLRFESGVEGEFLRSDGWPTAFFASPASSGDRVVVGLSRLGGDRGVDGAGELCRLRFIAVGPGEAGFEFQRARVLDSGRGGLGASFSPAPLRVE